MEWRLGVVRKELARDGRQAKLEKYGKSVTIYPVV
jgi:hypothetical protein